MKDDLFCEKLKDIIEQEYEIEVRKIEKSETSTDGNVYIINTDKYVLKIYKDIEHTKSMVELHNFLYERKFFLPKVIENKKKKLYTEIGENQNIVLYSFLRGKQLKQVKQISEEKFSKNVTKLANELRRFHDITSGKNIFNLREVPFKNNITTERYSTLHFDLTKDNIFYDMEIDKIGFIDFDDAKYGQSIIDVSIACALIFISKKQGIDIENMQFFINSYYKDNENLKQKETPFIKDIVIEWVNYVTSGNEFDTSTNESFEIKKKLIESVL